jgi:hypothetical protein
MDPRGFPETLPEFQRVFPDDLACAKYLEALRWPEGFSCPKCGAVGEPWRFAARPGVLRCRSCKSNVSLTGGTAMHKAHTSLSTWFWAAYLVTTQTPGISALQFQRQLGLTRYETAYVLLQKLRSSMVRADRDRIGEEFPVEVDEVLVGGKNRGAGRGVHKKTFVLGAVEVRSRKPTEDKAATGSEAHKGGKPLKRQVYAGRLRLQVCSDRKAATCESFVCGNVAPGAVVKTDGYQGYDSLRVGGYRHEALALNADPELAEGHLPMVHLVFSNFKTWLHGTHHGRIEPKHLQAYCNEYVFRFNRRFYPMTAFNSAFGLAVKSVPPTYAQLYSGQWSHPGSQAAPPTLPA